MKLTRTTTAVGAVFALVIGGGIASAAIPNGDGSVNVCYMKSGGAIRIIDAGKTCKTGETFLVLGAKGADGIDGDPGEPGADGVSGYTRVAQDDTFIFPIPASSYAVTVSCGTGQKVFGGGGFSSFDGGATYIAASYPISDTGWRVIYGLVGGNFAAGDELDWNAFATCATA